MKEPLDLQSIAEFTRSEFSVNSLLDREWKVLERSGDVAIIPPLMELQYFRDMHGLSEPELRLRWKDFLSEGLSIARNILEDLGAEPPDEISMYEESLFEALSQHKLAVIEVTTDGTCKLIFNFDTLISFFIGFIGKDMKSFQSSVWWYKFQLTLAHELRHLWQIRKFPKLMQAQSEKPDRERLIEYDARLYSLKWLRIVRPINMSDQLGLWIARAYVLINHLSPYDNIRDRIHQSFGVKRPTIFSAIRMILLSEKKL